MNDATALRLAQVLKFNGSAVIDDRASLQRLLAPGQAQVPTDIAALLLMLDTKAVAHLFKWARSSEAGKPSYTQMRDHIALKYEQAGKLSAATAARALDAWMNAVPELQRAMTPAARDLSLEALPPPPPPAVIPGQAPGSSPSNASTPQHARSATQAPAHAVNPYAPPQAHVDDVDEPAVDATFVESGRAVAFGQGWEWFAQGWRLFARQPLMWWLVLIVWIVISVVVQIVPFVGPIIGLLIAPILMAGLMMGADAVRQGESLSVGHVFAGFKNATGSLILVALLQLVAVIAIIGILFLLFGGSLLALGAAAMSGKPPTYAMINSMLGIIIVGGALFAVLSVTYYFSPALVAIDGCGPLAAFGRAFTASIKNVLPGLLFSIVWVVAVIVSVLPVFLHWILVAAIWIVLTPMLFTSFYAAYYDIFHAPGGSPAPSRPGSRPETGSMPAKRLARTLTPAANVPVARAPEDR